MTFVMSNWGSTHSGMSWLDGDTGCSGDCDMDPTIYFSNFEISGTSPAPPHKGKFSCSDGGCPSMGIGQFSDFNTCLVSCSSSYTFGNACKNPTDGLCGPNCTNGSCDWSWPTNDPAKWDSKDANCRC